MPSVTLHSSNGTKQTRSCGCFGFCGRSDSSEYDEGALFRDGGKIETFQYNFGSQWSGKSELKALDPKPYLEWLLASSPWAKYFKDMALESPIGSSKDLNHINIKTDIPGHCVIGAASAARLASHKAAEFIPFWNLCNSAGFNPAIAMLVYYSLYTTVNVDMSCDATTGVYKQTTITRPKDCLALNPSGKLSMSDDEVMHLNSISPGMVYSFIRGDFEMSREDNSSEDLYKDRPKYEQYILSSFRARSGGKNLGKFFLDRFHNSLRHSDFQVMQGGGMGSSTTGVITKHSPVYLSQLIGWVAVLSQEFKVHGKFLGFGS